MNTETPPLDPHNTILVCKHNGKEVGRIAATAKNAPQVLQEWAKTYKTGIVEPIEDKDAAMISRLLSPR